MLGQTFYHQTIRKYVTLFGTLFNDINIEKKNSSGKVVSRQKVPIAYGPKQKFIQRLRQDPNLTKQVAIQLPRLAFEMTGMSYDPARKLNTVGKITQRSVVNGHNTLAKQFNPSPYIFDFSLYAFVENAEDGTQILEQILPFFTPEFNVSVNIITEMGVKLDIPIIIGGASSEDSYEGEFSTRRTIIWTINFSLKGFIYPDIKKGGKIIKSIDIAFRQQPEDEFASSELNKLVLESSTNFSESYLRLDTQDLNEKSSDFIVFEDSNINLGRNNIISKIKITPEGGSEQFIEPGDDFTANTQITVFNPPVDYNDENGEFS